MSIRPSSSASRSRASGEYRELRVDNKPAVKALIYFSGRNPRKTKSIRRYYEEDFDARSTGSSGSMFSWSSGTSSVCLVETTNPYWYWDGAADSTPYSSSPSRSSRKRKSSSKKGRSSRSSHRTSPTPTGSTWGPRPATVEDDDDDDDYDDDSSSSSEWGDDYGDQPAAGGAYPPPHPGMMHPGPPPGGAYHPVYGGGMPYPPHGTPHPGMHPNGFPMPPPPPPMAGGMPPPPPPGGHFVTGRDGIQVFVDG
ncbi:hypothetical protein N657DRAFT_629549 [Parathielavia appendiculata]|uniref:Uncharacterized protein n=1 Tax=Parathielavia appendiculata TaxID=2587402 RepID=A0AAN6U8N7_9PEZI|nr:hypothetical protein N657DRAFT_629549 [Parathielavia appendiculata]